MEKIKCNHPQAYEIYLQNKILFETDAELSKKIMHLSVKDKMALNSTVKEIYAQYVVVT